jgi:hypothetical protein
MEAPGGVEPPTNGLGNRCSIQLSYGASAAKLIISREFEHAARERSSKQNRTLACERTHKGRSFSAG